MTTIQRLVDKLKDHKNAERIGMIASHLGIVRATSLDGRAVSAIEVSYEPKSVNAIINETKSLSGIVDVLVEFFEGHLNVGDEILAVAVAGETRETVFPALIKTVDRIKAEAVKKKEVFV
jgi:molybdopterin synthase catalytic subunit